MSPRYNVDYDDSRIFVDQNKLRTQIQNLMEHIRSTITYSSDDNLDEEVAAAKVFIEKEHNAVFLGYDAARMCGYGFPATVAFDTQSDFVMFMLRWS